MTFCHKREKILYLMWFLTFIFTPCLWGTSNLTLDQNRHEQSPLCSLHTCFTHLLCIDNLLNLIRPIKICLSLSITVLLMKLISRVLDVKTAKITKHISFCKLEMLLVLQKKIILSIVIFM